MLGFAPVSEWWARQGLNLRPHPCEGFSGRKSGGNPSIARGTEGDSSANESGFADHLLTMAGAA